MKKILGNGRKEVPAKKLDWREANCERMPPLAQEIFTEVLQCRIKSSKKSFEDHNGRKEVPAKKLDWRDVYRERVYSFLQLQTNHHP